VPSWRGCSRSGVGGATASPLTPPGRTGPAMVSHCLSFIGFNRRASALPAGPRHPPPLKHLLVWNLGPSSRDRLPLNCSGLAPDGPLGSSHLPTFRF